jgi:hypothetical protein
MASNSNQPRQPRGLSTGGQYAARRNPESNVTLVEEGVAHAKNYARHLISRYGLATGSGKSINGYMDSDDLSQDAALAYLLAADTDKWSNDIEEIPVRVIAKRAVIRALDKGRGRENAAYRRFAIARFEQENRLGRSLSPLETEEMAEKIRQEIAPSQRPGAGYHHRITTVSLNDYRATDSGENVDASLLDYRAFENDQNARVVTDDFAEGSAGDRMWARIEAEGSDRSRVYAWEAIAESTGAPGVERGSLAKRAATKARNEVREEGGALACAQAFLDEGRVVPGFFAPFGDITDDDRYRVSNAIEKFPDYANDLWYAAASMAEGRARA